MASPTSPAPGTSSMPLPIFVCWVPREGFSPPAGPVPSQCPTSIALTFAESWSDCGLLFFTAAVTGQVALEQHERELAVREGDGVTFQCSMSGGSMSSYYMYWYRQGSRGSLDWIYAGGSYGEGFRDRCTGSLQSSQNRFTLQIRAAKPEDEAVYYCAARLTLEQLCSRVDQKPTDREYPLLSISF